MSSTKTRDISSNRNTTAPMNHKLVNNALNDKSLNLMSSIFFEKIPVNGNIPKTCGSANTRN